MLMASKICNMIFLFSFTLRWSSSSSCPDKSSHRVLSQQSRILSHQYSCKSLRQWCQIFSLHLSRVSQGIWRWWTQLKLCQDLSAARRGGPRLGQRRCTHFSLSSKKTMALIHYLSPEANKKDQENVFGKERRCEACRPLTHMGEAANEYIQHLLFFRFGERGRSWKLTKPKHGC